MPKAFALGILSALIPGLARAETILLTGNYSYNQSIPAPSLGAPHSLDSLPFAGFDPSLGTLTNVSVNATFLGSWQLIAQNDTAFLSGVNEQFTFTTAYATSTADVLQTSSQQFAFLTGNVPAHNSATFSLNNVSLSAGPVSASATNLGNYVGNGLTYSVDISDTLTPQVSNFYFAGPISSAFAGSGAVTVAYTYTPVPEPSSFMLLGVVACFILRRRRGYRSRRPLVAPRTQ